MTYPRNRLSRRSASRLLDRQDRAASTSLAALMTALTATVDADPVGEATATARFREAVHRGSLGTAARSPVLTRIVRKAVAAPVAALAAASLLLGGGGLAVAAAQGAIDVPFTGHDNRSDQAPSSTNPGLDRAGTAGPRGEATGTGSAGTTPGATPSAAPSPSLPGLCHAYRGGAYRDGTSSPAWKVLVRAAGGAEDVAEFCTDLIGPATKATKAPKPTRAVEPTTPAEPTENADPTRSVAPPSGRPTGRPTSSHSKNR